MVLTRGKIPLTAPALQISARPLALVRKRDRQTASHHLDVSQDLLPKCDLHLDLANVGQHVGRRHAQLDRIQKTGKRGIDEIHLNISRNPTRPYRPDNNQTAVLVIRRDLRALA